MRILTFFDFGNFSKFNRNSDGGICGEIFGGFNLNMTTIFKDYNFYTIFDSVFEGSEFRRKTVSAQSDPSEYFRRKKSDDAAGCVCPYRG